ncbi:zinc finger and SCAN domain-containing protein 4-like [Nannospalax galili]|uniref:zinc finger and SCAN domain-containing protein 4-like n=1 Tax=Nannospalax galili TaxID=1026970 RepID=UPI0004ED3D3D|nr:zinc finger and SCAN domain-containing protein 4-like [Nannospalax galili]
MTSHLRKPEPSEPSSDALELNILDIKPTEDLTAQSGELSKLPSAQLHSPPHGNGSCAKQELQSLGEWFNSWLQPEKHTKEEMMSQLIMEQFVLTGRCKDRSALKEKWESSGRNMETFMEDLTDDCLKPPVWVHVFMQGEEALFPEHMPLKEVIMHLKEQRSAKMSTEDHARPFQPPEDGPLDMGESGETGHQRGVVLGSFLGQCFIGFLISSGHEDEEQTTEMDDRLPGRGNQIESLIIIQENSAEPEEGGVSYGNPQDATVASQGTSRSQEVSVKEPSHEDVSMEVQPGFPCRPEQSTSGPNPVHKNHERNSLCERQQEISHHRVKKPYKCEQCQQLFRHRCYLLTHQKRHRNERTVFCGECHKGFYQQSELRVHQVIHSGEKPFKCSMCEKTFSNKTNLVAHQRIHTGEKPYRCSVCHANFRQSSTYHRHMRNYHKGD